MTPAQRHARLKEIVFLASRMTGAERDELLRRECGDDEALRREAVAILSSAISTRDALGSLEETTGDARPAVRSVALPGSVGAYALGRELGRGGMGMVFEARDKRSGESVAVKILHPGLVTGEGAVDRFAREVRVGASITHGGVVRTLDAGTDVVNGQELHWLVMERVEGRTLRRLLADLGEVPEGLVREIGRQCAAALSAIHAAGVVHRDLKPENVLITDDQRIRIMDLGVAKMAEVSVSLTREGQFLGSVSHASPEQLEGRDVGPAADLYALGVTLHELCSGGNPFLREGMGATIRAHLEVVPPSLPRVSPFLGDVIATLLEKTPDRRIESAVALQRIFAEGESSAWWRERLQRRTAAPARIPAARATPVVGRATEIDALSAAWRSARRGSGGSVLLVGEAGIGKTRLLAELADLAGADDALVLHSSLARGDGACPFGSALADAFGAGAAEDARGRLARWPSLAAAVASLAGGDIPPADASSELLGIGFARWMQSAALERPVAWFLDDAHLAPAEVASIARSLATAAAGRRALVIVAGRDDGEAAWMQPLSSVEAIQRLTLDRLERRDVVRLVELALGSEEIALRLGPRLALRSDGVPAFALALLRSLQERGALRRDPAGAWRLDDGAEDIDLPKAARDAATARLSGLSRDARDVLDAASVQGLAFDAELVAEQLGRPLVRVLQDLAELERRHELVRSEGRLHALDGRILLEVLHDELPEMLRRAHHASLAEALLRRVPAGRAPDPRECAEIAGHHLRGRRPEDAVPLLKRALEHAAARNMHRDVVEMTALALGMGDRLPLPERTACLVRRASAFLVLGRRDDHGEVGALALRAAEELGDPVLLADACLLRGLHHFLSNESDAAIEWLQRAASIARDAGDVRAELRATRNLATALGRAGRLDEAIELHRWCRATAREAGDGLTEAMSCVNLGAVRITHGLLSDALRSYAEGVELSRAAGDVRIEAHAEGGLGLTLLHLGRRDESHAHALRQAELSREIGDRRSESLGLGTAGLASIERGRLGEALSLLTRAAELTDAIRDPRGITISTGNLATAHALLGDLDQARNLLEIAMAPARALDLRLILAAHLMRQALFDEHEGNLDGMLAAAREAEPLFRQSLDSEGLAHSKMVQGSALLAMGREAEAAATLDEAIAMSAGLEAPSLLVLSTLHRALLAGGDVAGGVELLLRHEARIGVGDRMLARRAAWKATGDRSHLARAHELLETLRAQAPAAHRDALVERVPARAEIARAWGSREVS